MELTLFADLFTESLDLPEPPAEGEPELSLAHVWIVAAEIKVEERVAKVAVFRGSFTTLADTRQKLSLGVGGRVAYVGNCVQGGPPWVVGWVALARLVRYETAFSVQHPDSRFPESAD
ncbi:hypothetical protein [Streptomyces sp. NPDC006863]|uniref:hypothetical protein n=1 Tax=unclassified Streptomyces TaxID=2593676 RepID=UPI0033DDAA8F